MKSKRDDTMKSILRLRLYQLSPQQIRSLLVILFFKVIKIMNYKRTLSSQQFLQPQAYLNNARSLQRIKAYQKYASNLNPVPPTYSRVTQSIPQRLQFHSPCHQEKMLTSYQYKAPKQQLLPVRLSMETIKPYSLAIQSKPPEQTMKNNIYVTQKQKHEPNKQTQQDLERVFQKSSEILEALKKKLETVRGVNKQLILQNCKLRSRLSKLENQS